MLLGGAEFVEQIKRVIHHPIRACTGAIHFVYHYDGFQAQRQRLARHKPRLRHGAFNRIDQQQHAVHHRQYTLHFAAKIGVAGGIDDIDMRAVPHHRAVFREDGDAALFFDIVRIHHALFQVLVRGKRAGLPQQLIDQRGFAVVDVGDDGDVADCAWHGGACLKKGRDSSISVRK